MRNRKGITLIALVITIVILVILAGISINLILGENGIISRASNLNKVQSVAMLEEFLQMKCAEDYEEFSKCDSKLEFLINKYPEYIYKPNESIDFVTDGSTGHIYYFINKEGLPNNIKKQLSGGDAGDKTYYDYSTFKDVYGITKDLKVFYCESGKDTRIGAEDEKNIDDPTRIAISNTSEISTFLKSKYSDMIKTDEAGNILAEGLTLIKKIEIMNASQLTSIKDLDNLKGLQELYIKGITLNSLDGIQDLSSINYIYFENQTIGDYSQMKNLGNLKYLYLYNTNNSEVEKLCEGIKEAKYSKLEYFGIYGYCSTVHTNNTWLTNTKAGQVSSISGLNKLNDITKNAIKYMYLNNNYITDISSLSGFKNLLELRLQQNSIVDINSLSNMTNLINLYINNNKIETLKGMKNLQKISYVYAQNNNIGKNETTNGKSSTDGLIDLKANKSLKYIHLGNNVNLKWVSYLSECTALRYLYFDECNNILDIADISNIIKQCGGNCVYPTKYSLALSSNVEKLDLNNNTYEINFFKTSLTGKTNIKYLSLKNLKLTDTSGNVITNIDTINTTLNDILKTLTNLQTLQLQNISQLKEITFINQVTNLTELDLRGTKVTTGTKDSNGAYTGLELLNTKATKIKTLALDSTNTSSPINLVNIQDTINRLRNGMQTGCWVCGYGSDGGLIASDPIYKTLENCDKITTLYIGRHNITYSSVNLDLSNCTLLNYISFCGMSGTLKFPASLKNACLVYSRRKTYLCRRYRKYKYIRTGLLFITRTRKYYY